MKESRKKDAYVILWQEDDKDGVERDCFVMPEKPAAVENNCYQILTSSYIESTGRVYLKDYRDVEKYIKKHLSDKKSNFLIAKVVDVIEVNLKSVDD